MHDLKGRLFACGKADACGGTAVARASKDSLVLQENALTTKVTAHVKLGGVSNIGSCRRT